MPVDDPPTLAGFYFSKNIGLPVDSLQRFADNPPASNKRHRQDSSSTQRIEQDPRGVSLKRVHSAAG